MTRPLVTQLLRREAVRPLAVYQHRGLVNPMSFGATPISMLAPLQAYCAQIDPRLHFCEAWGSCTYHQHKCPDAPYETPPEVPSLDACLYSNMQYCTNYSMPEQVLACQNGVSYSQRPRVLLDGDTLRSVTLFTDAFTDGMSQSLKCHPGVMPLY